MSARKLIEQLLQEMPEVSLQGKTAVTPEGQRLRDLPSEASEENIVVLRQPVDNAFIAKGWTLVYYLDTPEAAKAMREGKIPYLLIPVGTFHSGGDPITDVWKKRFQKPGHEHILGILQGHSDEGRIFIDMMSVRAKWQRNRINSLMIDALKREYPQAKLSFSSPTDKGQKFINRYAPGAPIEK